MRVLIVDDDPSVITVCRAILKRKGYDVNVAHGGDEAWKLYHCHPFPVVVTDIQMPDGNGLDLLNRIKARSNGSTAVIMMSGIADSDTVGRTYAAGAFEFLTKPVSMEQLADSVRRACEAVDMPAGAPASASILPEDLIARVQEIHGIRVVTEHMQKVVKLALSFHRAANAPVLIQGETGTGKEKVARLIHKGVEPDGGPFIDLNCAAISPQLLESELFGYADGAFTGARSGGQPGKFELADGGSLFLDEIGEMPLEFQSKLLRVLEQREVRRVGGSRNKRINTRIVCATNCDLAELVRQGQFRSDLFHRLNVGYVRLQPLRERKDAVAPLADAFLKNIARELQKPFETLEPGAVAALEHYDWPGNIRELRNTIERAVLLHNDTVLRREYLHFIHTTACALDRHATDAVPADAALLQPGAIELPPQGIDLEAVENEIVLKALRLNDDNKSRTARFLGISRSKLLTRLDRIDADTGV